MSEPLRIAAAPPGVHTPGHHRQNQWPAVIATSFSSSKRAVPRGRKAQPNSFVPNLYKILADTNSQGLIDWDASGTFFRVNNPNTVGPLFRKYYKHDNWASFVRQLNTYGFWKKGKGEGYEIGHDFFVKDKPDLLERIVRRTGPRERRGKRANNKTQSMSVAGLGHATNSSCINGPLRGLHLLHAKPTSSTSAPLTPSFLHQLHRTLGEGHLAGIIDWHTSGAFFRVSNAVSLSTFLPQFELASDFPSFLRQLSAHGFWTQLSNGCYEAGHDMFRRSQPQLMEGIFQQQQQKRHNFEPVVLPGGAIAPPRKRHRVSPTHGQSTTAHILPSQNVAGAGTLSAGLTLPTCTTSVANTASSAAIAIRPASTTSMNSIVSPSSTCTTPHVYGAKPDVSVSDTSQSTGSTPDGSSIKGAGSLLLAAADVFAAAAVSASTQHTITSTTSHCNSIGTTKGKLDAQDLPETAAAKNTKPSVLICQAAAAAASKACNQRSQGEGSHPYTSGSEHSTSSASSAGSSRASSPLCAERGEGAEIITECAEVSLSNHQSQQHEAQQQQQSQQQHVVQEQRVQARGLPLHTPDALAALPVYSGESVGGVGRQVQCVRALEERLVRIERDAEQKDALIRALIGRVGVLEDTITALTGTKQAQSQSANAVDGGTQTTDNAHANTSAL